MKIICQKKSQAFFNSLKELLLVQKKTILQQKGPILSFLELALSGGLHAHLLQKDIEKKVNLTETSRDSKTCFLITPIIYLYYAHCF